MLTFFSILTIGFGVCSEVNGKKLLRLHSRNDVCNRKQCAVVLSNSTCGTMPPWQPIDNILPEAAAQTYTLQLSDETRKFDFYWQMSCPVVMVAARGVAGFFSKGALHKFIKFFSKHLPDCLPPPPSATRLVGAAVKGHPLIIVRMPGC